MSVIYLIRHGKTVANETHLYCGSTDLPLSDAGTEELSELRYDIKPDRFITSGMARTDETLRVLFGNVPFRRDEAFREMDFGDFEMKSYDEMKNNPAYQKWISGDNEANVPPGGESGAQMTKRVLRAFSELKKLPGSTVLITHGGVIAAVMASEFPEEGKNRYLWQPAPGHGYALYANRYDILLPDRML